MKVGASSSRARAVCYEGLPAARSGVVVGEPVVAGGAEVANAGFGVFTPLEDAVVVVGVVFVYAPMAVADEVGGQVETVRAELAKPVKQLPL